MRKASVMAAASTARRAAGVAPTMESRSCRAARVAPLDKGSTALPVEGVHTLEVDDQHRRALVEAAVQILVECDRGRTLDPSSNRHDHRAAQMTRP